MIAPVELSEAEAQLVIREATALAADRMLAEALLTREQSAKVLAVSLATLNRLPIKRVKIGASTAYRMSDLKAYVESCLE